MANDTNKGGESQNPPPPQPPAPPKEKPKRVRVICEGTLGYLGLKKGEMTEDEGYVGLLKTKRGKTLVEEVK